MRAFVACLLVACAAVAACTGFGADTSAPPAGTPDAAADDGGSPEGSAQPSDAGANSACAKDHPTAAFCDDFDNGGYHPDWKADVGAGITMSIVSAPHVSAPFALAARSVGPAPDGGASKFLHATKSTAGATEFTLEADLQLTAGSPSVGNTAPRVMLLQLGPKAFVLFQIRSSGEVAACTTSGAELGGADVPFTYGKWHHVVLRVSLGDASGVLDVSCDVDGTTTRSGTQNDVINATADLSVGLAVLAGQDAMTVLFDNVVYDAK